MALLVLIILVFPFAVELLVKESHTHFSPFLYLIVLEFIIKSRQNKRHELLFLALLQTAFPARELFVDDRITLGDASQSELSNPKSVVWLQ